MSKGGKRNGSGAKLRGKSKRVTKCIRIEPAMIKKGKRAGGGSLSEGVDKALRAYVD